MANAQTLVNLGGSPDRFRVYFTDVIDSGPTQETNLVIYDSSVVSALFGLADPLMCHITEAYLYCSSIATNPQVTLKWDATTKVNAVAVPCGSAGPIQYCFSQQPLKNQGGSGITGDIVLTTTGLVAGDQIFIVLDVIVG